MSETIKPGIKMNAEDILFYLQHNGFNNNYTLGVSEFCPYGEGRRLDVFYFNRWNRETMGYEIKVSRGDFLQDKKWESYLKFCTRFYFVAPKGIIKTEELPEGIGLIEIEIVEDKYAHGWRDEVPEDEKVWKLNHTYTKKCKKLHDVEEKEYIQLLEGLLVKMVYRKNIIL